MRMTPVSTRPAAFSEPRARAITPFSCKLFSDFATASLCRIRRKELVFTGYFSCEGCPREAEFVVSRAKGELQ